jgi:hypothetical protein
MNSFVMRPTFYEGQLLAASDLGALVDYGRARGERHDRHLHRPGIVTGLALETQDATDASGTTYKRVFVAPGLAIDLLGREILVDERIEVDAQRFRQTIGASADATSFFPVYVRSQFVGQPAASSGLGLCQTTQGSRIEERVDVFVGRAGDETTIETEVAPPGTKASAGEGAGPPLLLGFVQWNPAAGQFSGIAESANGVLRRYAGINAATLAGIGNRVLVQLKPTFAAGDLAFELDGTAGALRFGPLQASGTIGDPLMSVDKDGNVTAKGTLSGRSAAGAVLVQSGLASDGLILPLPPGVTEDQVAEGEAEVHVLVSPHIDPAQAPVTVAQPFWAGLAEECRVDSGRRLHCRISWMSLDFIGGAQGTTLVSAPGAADYVVIASTRSGGS